MPIYDGLVSLAGNQIPVIVELDESRLRLSASGTEIGEWPIADCEISHVDDTTYAISAEDETLTFVPSQPTLFAAAIGNGGRPSPSVPEPAGTTIQPTKVIGEAPAPRLATVVLFYGLCLATLALAVWAIIEIVL